MNKLIVIADGVEYAFVALSYLVLAMWLFPDLASALGVDMKASAPRALTLLAALGLLRPWLYAKTIGARAKLVLMASRSQRKKQ